MECSIPPILFLMIPIFSILLSYIFLSQKHKGEKSHTNIKRPPSPPKLPIIGHLHLITDMPHHAFAKLASQLGPIFYLQLGQVPTIVISSAELAKQVLKTYDHIFASRPRLIAAQYLSFGCSDVTFSPYGPYWRQVRKICVTELLSARRVSSFQLVREEETDQLISSVSSSHGSEVNMSKLFFSLANNILCRVAFGKRFMENPGDGKRKQLVNVLKETQALLAGFSLGDFFPAWEWVNTMTGLKRRLERNLKDLRAVCDEIIEEHATKIENRSSSSAREDFMDVLLRVQCKEDLEVPITGDNLKALVLDMFVAGTDTTAATLEWTMTELARHPRVMEKAQAEVHEIASSREAITEDQLQHLHYLKAVIKETMRLHPPVPLLVPRESIERCILNGYEIPAKTRVLINTYALGRDVRLWENPLEFIPERFEGSNLDVKDKDFRLLPFGAGRRGCPGYSFGLATTQITLARLLFHFDWSLPPGKNASDVDLNETFGLATRKKSEVILIPTVHKG